MVKEDLLQLETRRMIYNFILKYPGLYLSELSRRLNIPKSTTYYHLKYLKKRGFLVEKYNDRYTRYYVTKKIGEIDKKILNLLRQEVPRNIVLFVFRYPGSSRYEISTHLKKHPTTISFHLKKLIDVDIIERIQIGNEIKYMINHKRDIVDLLITYKKKFI